MPRKPRYLGRERRARSAVTRRELASVLGGALLLPLSPTSAEPAPGAPYGDLKEVRLEGRIILLGEEMARRYGAKLAGAGPDLQRALAGPLGEIHNLLDNAAYRRLMAAGLDGRAVEIRGRLFPRSHLVEVLEFREIRADVLRRRFYCSVCAISGEEWGPCVCCGREMEPVRTSP